MEKRLFAEEAFAKAVGGTASLDQVVQTLKEVRFFRAPLWPRDSQFWKTIVIPAQFGSIYIFGWFVSANVLFQSRPPPIQNN